MSENKKKGGQVIVDHENLALNLEDDIIEYRRSMEPDIVARIHDTVSKTKATDGYVNRDFYVVLITTTDRVLRHPKITLLSRKSCPTPVYKQSVWKYKTNTGNLEFLWSIPDAILYYHILRNKAKCLENKDTADLAKFVILMENGELLKWVKKENGEKIDAVIKIKNEENECLMN